MSTRYKIHSSSLGGDRANYNRFKLVYLSGRNAAEGKGDVQLCLRELNNGLCVEMKAGFTRP